MGQAQPVLYGIHNTCISHRALLQSSLPTSTAAAVMLTRLGLTTTLAAAAQPTMQPSDKLPVQLIASGFVNLFCACLQLRSFRNIGQAELKLGILLCLGTLGHLGPGKLYGENVAKAFGIYTNLQRGRALLNPVCMSAPVTAR